MLALSKIELATDNGCSACKTSCATVCLPSHIFREENNRIRHPSGAILPL